MIQVRDHGRYNNSLLKHSKQEGAPAWPRYVSHFGAQCLAWAYAEQTTPCPASINTSFTYGETETRSMTAIGSSSFGLAHPWARGLPAQGHALLMLLFAYLSAGVDRAAAADVQAALRAGDAALASGAYSSALAAYTEAIGEG